MIRPAAQLGGAGQGLMAGESLRWCQRLKVFPDPREERGGLCGVVLYVLLHTPLSNWQCVPHDLLFEAFLRARSVKNLTWMESLVIQIFGQYSAAGVGGAHG